VELLISLQGCSGDWDDVRAYRYKAERAAILIYTHFRNEFGIPIEQKGQSQNNSKKQFR
jgi:hypothetical protein